jgi:hypothetical protein
MHKALFCLTLVCLGVPCVGAPVCADVVPAFLFNDNAVLQRDKPIPVWGTADAGQKISVAFAGYMVATTADATGKWRVNLPALPANASPTNLVIEGKNTVTRTNILVGEVIRTSGSGSSVMYNTCRLMAMQRSKNEKQNIFSMCGCNDVRICRLRRGGGVLLRLS